MIKIQSSDYNFLNISFNTSYASSDPVTVANLDMSYDFKQKWQLMIEMLQEWQEQKRFINSNPAVKSSYEAFQTMVALAKEPA